MPEMNADVWSSSGFVRSIAKTPRGDFRPYGTVVLPFIVVRRLDCIAGCLSNARDTELTEKGIVRHARDLLVLADEVPKAFNPSIRVALSSHALNGESFDLYKSDMPVNGYDPERTAIGKTPANDADKGKPFHCLLSNPPCGAGWKKHRGRTPEEARTPCTEWERFQRDASLELRR